MNLTQRETETYEDAFSTPFYGDYSPGERYADLFASLATPGATVLDAGCGSGKGMVALAARGFQVEGFDLTASGLVDEAKRFPFIAGSLWRPIPVMMVPYVYCTDVLEHIPPQFTLLVVSNLLAVAKRGVFLSISLVPDQMGVWVGRPLHLSVRRYDEWLTDFREIATVVDARDMGTTATFMLRSL
jgi:2-polyprenyl-3-methyl-5-hydroxy-6-metoxy-1,4-benzoquinol methylase